MSSHASDCHCYRCQRNLEVNAGFILAGAMALVMIVGAVWNTMVDITGWQILGSIGKAIMLLITGLPFSVIPYLMIAGIASALGIFSKLIVFGVGSIPRVGPALALFATALLGGYIGWVMGRWFGGVMDGYLIWTWIAAASDSNLASFVPHLYVVPGAVISLIFCLATAYTDD